MSGFSLEFLDTLRRQNQDRIFLKQEFNFIEDSDIDKLRDPNYDRSDWINPIISTVKSMNLDFNLLVNFYRVLMYYGFFCSAWDFRKIILQKSANFKGWNSFFFKLMENENFQLTQKTLNVLLNLGFLWKYRKNKSLKILREKFKTRSNIIIGPSMEDFSYLDFSMYDNLNEIKRVNHGVNLINNQSNIIWFNNQHSNGDLIKISALKKRKNTFLITKAVSQYSDINFPNFNPFWIGSPMMLQNIVQTIHYCGCKSIDIIGFNLYTTSQPYDSKYPVENKSLLTDAFSRRISLALHDPFSNLFCLKNLYHIKAIHPIGQLKEVLDLNIEGYIERLKLAN
jgi:hypothetical protein